MKTPPAIKTWHHDTYEAISPNRPELSATGKTVVITGAGSGIGRESSLAFAAAGASHIALLGRREPALRETAQAIAALSTQTKVSIHPIDVSDDKAMRDIVEAIGIWDTLVHAAGHFSAPRPIATTDIGDYWKAFETNTKGTLVVLQCFAKTANRGKATICCITTGAVAAPAGVAPTFSSYMASKLAQIKIVEHFASENPDIAAINFHPGFVDTDIFRRTGFDAAMLPMDTAQLPAHFAVWLSSPEARFLSGRTVSANWDVTDIKARASSLAQGADWMSTITAWQFSAA